MKRSLILVGLLCLSLLPLSGCASQPQEDMVLPEQSAPVQEPAPDPDPIPQTPTPIQQEPQPAPLPQLPVYTIQTGVWLAQTDLGYSNYYYFDEQTQSGHYVSLDYGLGRTFSYDGTGNELVFFMGDEAAAVSATLHTTNEDDDQSTDFSLEWSEGLPETLTYIGEGTLEDFPFYSNDQLGQLAVSHYARTEQIETPPALYGTLTNEDNTVTVQLYDDRGEHSSTSAWYIVDRFTGEGTDLLTGQAICLIEEEPSEELPGEETPAEGEVPPEEEVPGEEAPVEEPSEEEAAPEVETTPVEEVPAEDSVDTVPEA